MSYRTGKSGGKANLARQRGRVSAMHELSDRTVLVTGSSKGIGAAIAERLGAAGARVILHYGSDREGAERAARGIEPDRRALIGADFSRREAADTLWDAAERWAGGIDVLVNNAGVMLWGGGFEAPVADWDRVWDESAEINLMAPARLLRRAVSHFLGRNGGTIVTVSSWSAQRGATNTENIAYAATKAAIHAATQTVARAYAHRGILAYIVAPGVVDTRLSDQFAATQGGAEKVAAGLAMGEWVPPSEVAELVAWLAGGRCRHLCGATLDVNGASYVR